MKDGVPVGGWLRSSQPHLLTVAAARRSSLRAAGIDSQEGWGCPVRGEGEAGGPRGAGGRDECNIGGGKNSTAPRPVPPARPGPGIPLSTAGSRTSPRTQDALGSWVHLGGQRDWRPEEGEGGGKGGKREKGRPRYPGRRFPTPRRCARLLFEYSDC